MKKKGSMTVEASFLVPGIIFVIVLLIYLMFYSYNSITLWKNTYYVGLKVAEEKRGGIPYSLEQEWKELSKDTLVLPEGEMVTAKKKMDSIIVTGKTNFKIPFYGDVMLQQKSVVPICGFKKTVARVLKWTWQ